jgi:hypothetical protein
MGRFALLAGLLAGAKAVAMSLALTLSGTPSSLGRADTITPSARPGRVWLGRWRHVRRARARSSGRWRFRARRLARRIDPGGTVMSISIAP